MTHRHTGRRNGWHMQRSGDGVVLARLWPPRLDVAVTRVLPRARAGRMAHQIRQDLWRALQGLRGFSPVVQVVLTEHGLEVTAGGRLDRNTSRPSVEDRIAALLDCPRHQARWLNWAREGTT